MYKLTSVDRSVSCCTPDTGISAVLKRPYIIPALPLKVELRRPLFVVYSIDLTQNSMPLKGRPLGLRKMPICSAVKVLNPHSFKTLETSAAYQFASLSEPDALMVISWFVSSILERSMKGFSWLKELVIICSCSGVIVLHCAAASSTATFDLNTRLFDSVIEARSFACPASRFAMAASLYEAAASFPACLASSYHYCPV